MTRDEERNLEHQRKMIQRDKLFEERQSRASQRKGLVIVHTGAGKGKTTAALGMVLRALGNGMKVGIVKFIKGAIDNGESKFIEMLQQQGMPIELHNFGDGYTWKTQNLQQDIATARRGWAKTVELLRDPSFDILILDEMNIVLKYEYLSLDDVLTELSAKRHMLHVVITGRNAKAALIDVADLVTEMTQIKHPYRSGIMAQRGIEF